MIWKTNLLGTRVDAKVIWRAPAGPGRSAPGLTGPRFYCQMPPQRMDDFMLNLLTTRMNRRAWFLLTCITIAITLLCQSSFAAEATVPKWQRFELKLESSGAYANPVQEANLTAIFTSPGGSSRKVYGFWDGGNSWKIRFAPNEAGRWTYKTICSDAK